MNAKERMFSLRLPEELHQQIYANGGAEYVRRLLSEDRDRKAIQTVQANPEITAAAVAEALRQAIPTLTALVVESLGNVPAPQTAPANNLGATLMAHWNQVQASRTPVPPAASSTPEPSFEFHPPNTVMEMFREQQEVAHGD